MNQIQQGVLIAGAGIGYVFIMTDLFGKFFVGLIIFALVCFFCIVFWRKNQIKWRKEEFENSFIVRDGAVIAFDNRIADCPSYQRQSPANHFENTENNKYQDHVTSDEKNGDAPLIEHKKSNRIGDDLYPYRNETEEEKIIRLHISGKSKYEICNEIWGSKNGERYKKIENVINK